MTDPNDAIAELVRDNGQLQDRVCDLEMRYIALAAAYAILLTCVTVSAGSPKSSTASS